MNTNQNLLKVNHIEIVVLHKKVKNLHLNVLPPIGKVRVSAPLNMNDDAIHTFIATRISWIKKQQAKFKEQERQTLRKYISGESHYYFGKRYRLEVIYDNTKPMVTIKGKSKMILRVKPKSDLIKREKVMQEWYRYELRIVLNEMVKKWQKIIDVQVNYLAIRKMKTRWGTCDEKTKRMWFNLKLVKKLESCIEYVVVHELVHLLERKHNDKFASLMDKYLPKWRSEKNKLNRLILSYEKWDH